MVPNDTELEEISDEELSGPVVNRRTSLSLFSAAGLAGVTGYTGQLPTTRAETDTATATQEPETGGRLKAGFFTGSLEKLDPRWTDITHEVQVMGNIFNGLVEATPELEIVGDIAKDWTVEDKTSYTFNLEEGVKFHNGVECTAEDFEFTLRSIIEQESPVKTKLDPLKPLDEGGVNVIDDYTLELNLEYPYAAFLAALCRVDGRASTVVSKDAIEEMGEEQYNVAPVGTGPFKVTDHNPGSHLTLDAFEDYFKTDDGGNQLPYLDGVDISPIPEAAQMVNALRSGDIQFANLIPQQNLDTAKQANNVTIESGPGAGWSGLGFNIERELFSSRKVRRAIAKAIDSEQTVQEAFFGNAHVASGPIAPSHSWVFREDKPDNQAYDPEAATELLEEAGADGASFTILTRQTTLRIARSFRQQLQAVGLNVEINQVTSATYWERERAREYDVTPIGNGEDLDPDPAMYLFFVPQDQGGSLNDTGYSNERVTELMNQQRQSIDRDERKELLQEAEDIITADAPYVFTHHPKQYVGFRDEVQGYQPHIINRDLFTVRLSE